jgi:hypothetical protein
VVFSGFSGVSVIFGTVVMARRTGRRDCGMPGIPGEVANSGAGAAHGERRWPELGGAGGIHCTRAEEGRGGMIGILGR